MKRVALLLCCLFGLIAVSTAAAQDVYPDFALIVQLPTYETFLTNLGDSPLRVDGYQITSQSGSLSPGGWVRMGSSGSAIVAALGPGADQFFSANPSANHLAELNPLSSATWQPGQSWSIGFPFNSTDLNLVGETAFHFSSPDGFVLGVTVVPPGQLFPATFHVVAEPSRGELCLLAAIGILIFARRCNAKSAARRSA